MKKNWFLVLAFVLALLIGCTTQKAQQPAEAVASFSYVHDPKADPLAMADIKEDPSAVYGFSPREDSPRLGSFAAFDWSDKAIVETARLERISYHEGIKGLYAELATLQAEGNDTETCARIISALRNQARLEASQGNPEALEATKASNLQKYGNELGPTPESLYERYGSWQIVLQKAFSSNHGMDACLGLYDEQYGNYQLLGEI